MSRPAVGPKFIQFFGPLIESLKELGGSGRPDEVKDVIVKRLRISEKEQTEVISSGGSRFSNKVNWARFYLAKAGYIDSSTRGVWSLTDLGRSVNINHKESLAIFKSVRSDMKADTSPPSVTDDLDVTELHDDSVVGLPDIDYRNALLETILELSPNGFERLCQRLLRESGFENVTVTGRAGDGGIDGTLCAIMDETTSYKRLT